MKTDLQILYNDYMALVEKYNQLTKNYEEALETNFKLEQDLVAQKQENINMATEIVALKLNKLNEYGIATPEHLYEIEHGIADRALLIKALEDRDNAISYLNNQVSSLQDLLADDEFKPPIVPKLSITTNLLDNLSTSAIYEGSESEAEDSVDGWDIDDRYPDSP
jgi:hypothetical protein